MENVSNKYVHIVNNKWDMNMYVNTTETYKAGYSNGQNDGGLSIEAEDKAISATKSNDKVVYVRAQPNASMTYNSSTHKYSITYKAQAKTALGSTWIDMDSTTVSSDGKGYIQGYNDNRTADIDVHSATVGPNSSITVYARVTDYDGTTTNSGNECTIYGPTLTAMSNCKANVSRLSTAKLTLYIYEREQYRSVGNYYWYYSSTTGNPVTYYRWDVD